MKSFAIINFDAQVVREYSSRAFPVRLGLAKNSMELFMNENGREGYIEWVAEFEEGHENEIVGIGLWFNENKELTDYDGTFEMPREAVNFLREQGFIVTDEAAGIS